jgi:hypothetical protein
LGEHTRGPSYLFLLLLLLLLSGHLSELQYGLHRLLIKGVFVHINVLLQHHVIKSLVHFEKAPISSQQLLGHPA